jgi:hypothetical protein
MGEILNKTVGGATIWSVLVSVSVGQALDGLGCSERQ